MLRKKAKKKSGNATYASVKKEMAKPRMAKSVKLAERNPKKGARVKISVTAKDVDRDN